MRRKTKNYFLKWRSIFALLIALAMLFKWWWHSPPAATKSNAVIRKLAYNIHQNHSKTFYCDCLYQNKVIDIDSCGYKVYHNLKRATRLEWEHIVPVSILAKNFACWQLPICCEQQPCYKGRACCEKIDENYRIMSYDLHNLVPEIGELNGLRSNYSFNELPDLDWKQFGACQFKIDHKSRQVEAYGYKKGIIARAYLYMAKRYGFKLTLQQQKLYEKWHRQFPPTTWERSWNQQVAAIQGTDNEFISKDPILTH